MENIVIIEKLCEELQKSERPADLGVAIVLRVVLDENIILTERAEELSMETTKYKQANTRVVQRCIDLSNENAILKKLNAELSTSLEISKKLSELHKWNRQQEKLLVFPYRYGGTSKSLQQCLPTEDAKKVYADYLKEFPEMEKFLIRCKSSVNIVNPTQGKIDFPDTRAALTATPVNTREKSVYYKMAEWRAKRIYAVYCKDPDWFMLSTNHIVPWINKFFLKPGEKLTLSHIEFACLPKCYAGLGITTGIQLYNLLITTKK